MAEHQRGKSDGVRWNRSAQILFFVVTYQTPYGSRNNPRGEMSTMESVVTVGFSIKNGYKTIGMPSAENLYQE
jgi:hypothetical protein